MTVRDVKCVGIGLLLGCCLGGTAVLMAKKRVPNNKGPFVITFSVGKIIGEYDVEEVNGMHMWHFACSDIEEARKKRDTALKAVAAK